MPWIRALGAAAIALLLAAPPAAEAQPRAKVHRVGYLMSAAPGEMEHLTKALDEGLRELGYAEGRNIAFERRFAAGKLEQLPELAAELVRLNVDVIVSGANPVIAALKRATSTIPIVMVTSRDPAGSGFVATLARPGGNITGLTGDPTPEIQRKRLQLLKQLVPRATRVALLWNPLPPGAETYRKEVENAARQLGMTLLPVEARARSEFEGAFAAIARDRADAIVVLPDPVFYTARKQIVELATKHGLPAVHGQRDEVEAGGLLSYGSNLAAQFRRSAWYVDRILKGARPGELPVEQAATFEFAINLKTASVLGIAIPTSLRLQADHVLQ